METEKGFTVILGKNEYPQTTLTEAKAFIDSVYANAASRVLDFPMRAQ